MIFFDIFHLFKSYSCLHILLFLLLICFYMFVVINFLEQRSDLPGYSCSTFFAVYCITTNKYDDADDE